MFCSGFVCHAGGIGDVGLYGSKPLWSRLEYLNNYRIHSAKRLNPADFGDPLNFLSATSRSYFSCTQRSISTSTVCTDTKFCMGVLSI